VVAAEILGGAEHAYRVRLAISEAFHIAPDEREELEAWYAEHRTSRSLHGAN